MHIKISADYGEQEGDLIELISKYDSVGEILFDGKRNQIKIASLNTTKVAIKSFKIPNAFNRIVYKYFRKPKAQRSYEYAEFLLQNNIGTAKPVAYSLNFNAGGLLNSYYISEFLEVDLELRELISNENYPERVTILRQFTRFTHSLHQLGVEFLDHSPGNTLIKKISPGVYEFFLIDLNRMRFHTNLSFEKRLKNFKKLTYDEEVVKIISDEYAKISGQKADFIFEKIMNYSYKLKKKRKMKQKIKHLLSL